MLQTTSTEVGQSPMGTRSAAPAATVRIRPAGSALDLDLSALWHHGDLLYFLVWRDLKVRYKQMAIGAGWAVIQPVLTMLLFTAVFSGLANIPSNGVPYPIFAYAALLPWTYFSQAVARSGNSLVNNSSLITKVYFPRLIIPISAVLSPLLDFAVAFMLLLGLLVWYRIPPTWAWLALPLFLILCLATALAISLWLAALCVKYRDVGIVIPFLLQIWLFASPVAYPVSMVPAEWRLLYSLNPMSGVIEGFRWALFGTESPDFGVMAVSAAVVLVLLLTGAVFFRRTERTFADLA